MHSLKIICPNGHLGFAPLRTESFQLGVSAGVGYADQIWVGVFAPAGTPGALVQRLNRELIEVSRSPELRALLESDGALPMALTPAEAAQRVRDDLAMWKKVASEKNIVTE